MPATVLNSLAPTLPVSPSPQPPRAPENAADFASQLDRAKDTAKTDPKKATDKAKATERKIPRANNSSAKSGKKARSTPESDHSDTDTATRDDGGSTVTVDGTQEAGAAASTAGADPKAATGKTKDPAKLNGDASSADILIPTGTNGATAIPATPVDVKDAPAPAGQANTNATAEVSAVESTVSTDDPSAAKGDPEKAKETAKAFEASLAKATGSGHEKPRATNPVVDDPEAAPAIAPTAKAASKPAQTATFNPEVTDASAANVIATQATGLEKHAAEAEDSNAPSQGVLSQVSAAHTLVTNHLHPPAESATGPLPPETRFADANHAAIVSDVRTKLLPHGGAMEIRLDPPELGALQVSVEMRDGAMTATFQTSNEDATRLLSHSLGQLKTALESQGVTVEKIQVQQSPKNQQSQSQEEQTPQQQRDEASARQEQQRREMLNRMWRRVSGGSDPVDLVA